MKTIKPDDARSRVTDLYISLMLLLFPLFTGFQGYAEITLSKYLFFAVATALWLAALLGLSFRADRPARPDGAELIALAFGAWAVVSALCSPWRGQALIGASRYDGLVTTLLYVGIFLGVGRFGRWRRRYVYLLCASTLLCFAVALLQIGGSGILFPDDYTYYDAGLRFTGKFLGTIGNTNLLAAFLALAVPLFLSADAFGYPYPWFLRLGAFAGGFMLSFTESSGGLVALLAGAAVDMPLLAARGVLPGALFACAPACLGLSAGAMAAGNMVPAMGFALFALAAAGLGRLFACKVPRARHVPLLAALLVCLALLALLAVWFWPGTQGTAYELSRILHGEIQDEFGSSRLRIWREALSLVSERPILGGGPGTLALRLDIQFSRYFPELGQTLTTVADNAHNVYLGLLVNLGLPGLLSYLALMAVSAVKALRSGTAHGAMLLCVLLCAWAESFFGLGLPLTAPLLWILWALAGTQENETGDHES
jgi:hypothetical protein